jgi:hypothetical protein
MARSAVQLQHAADNRNSAMDISSITSSVPVSQTAVDTSTSSNSNTADSSSSSANAYPPPPPPPLPPGQGVRVDQLA